MEKIRAFIAIELSVDIKRTLTQLQNKLKSGCQAPVRWTDPDDTHLTLQFLGDTDSGLSGKIVAAMGVAAGGIHPFHLSVSELGVFPDPRRVGVVWVGLTGDLKQLNQLQKNIESAISPLGFTPEARAFTPHLTLGRVRDQARPEERQSLGQHVAKAAVESPSGLDVKSIHLIKSQLTPQGPVYTIIGSIELK
jgi:RNA 2',3'-cyclic 3'-phosphodiesterase